MSAYTVFVGLYWLCARAIYGAVPCGYCNAPVSEHRWRSAELGFHPKPKRQALKPGLIRSNDADLTKGDITPVSDFNAGVVDSLKVLDPRRPIRDAVIPEQYLSLKFQPPVVALYTKRSGR